MAMVTFVTSAAVVITTATATAAPATAGSRCLAGALGRPVLAGWCMWVTRQGRDPQFCRGVHCGGWGGLGVLGIVILSHVGHCGGWGEKLEKTR